MTDAEQPETLKKPGAAPSPPAVTPLRIVLWVIVGGAGIFMVVTGLVGVLVKAQ